MSEKTWKLFGRVRKGTTDYWCDLYKPGISLNASSMIVNSLCRLLPKITEYMRISSNDQFSPR
jgi:hypothetical protein